MNILFAANEAFPIYKLGGLGDVAGALPKALAQTQDIDIRLIIPHHQEISIATTQTTSFHATYQHRKEPVSISQTFLPNTTIPIYLVHNHTYLSTSTDASDNHADKYAFFSLAVSKWLAQHSPHWQPDLIHLNDWHTSFIPITLHHLYHHSIPTLLTIHNLAYQASSLTPVDQHLHLPPDSCDILSWDKQDMNINFLLEGILHASAVNTVSPTYAEEILTPEFSFGLDAVLKRAQKIHGILNGIDTHKFNPQTDTSLAKTYSVSTATQGKQANKKALQQQLGLPQNDKPLISFVGRIDSRQKGIDHIISALRQHTLPPPDTQFVFLGVGEQEPAQELHQQAKEKENVRIITRFDEPLSRQLYAASDVSIIPSSYEPCGLVQMIAMRYGSLPIAHSTGGLKDTIIHNHNGFLFSPLTTDGLIQAINHGLEAISNPTQHHQLLTNAMKADFSWSSSAQKYYKLYTRTISKHSSNLSD